MAYYDPYNQGLKQPTGPMATDGPSRFEKLSRALTGEVQRSSGMKLDGTMANIKRYPADLLHDSGMAKGAGLRANAVGAAKMGGRLYAAGNAGRALFGTVYDGATTSTEDYRKRFEGIGPDGDVIDKGSMVDKGLNAIGIGENERQFGRDLLTRAGGVITDYGARAAESLLGVDLKSRFADKQPANPAPQAAAQPQAATQPETAPKPLTPADDETIVGTGEHGFIAQQPKGLKSELYTNVPSQTEQFVASKGNVSTIQTGGAENYARQLANIQGLREGLGPAGGAVSFIANPDKKADSSPQDIIRKAIADLPRDMSPGNKAAAVADLVNVMNGANQIDTNKATVSARTQGQSDGTGKASFGDMLRMKEFGHKLQREGVEDRRWAASNALQQQSTGATLASTAANVASTNAKMEADEFSQLFRKRDADNKDVADTESISRFKGQLGQALATLANTNDPKDRQRYAIQYQGVDGPKWRAKQWGELDDATKNHLTQMFRYAERMQSLNDGGVGGGNFGMYNKPTRDAQGRLVVRDGDKIRAIVDANKLNSNDRSLFPFFSGVNESFGIERPKDYGSQFGAGR